MILEQSIPPRNSIRKVDCCVLLLQSAVLVGSRPNPTFQAEMQAELQRRDENKALYNALNCCICSIFCCKSMAQPIPQAWSHLVALNVEFNVLICTDVKCRYVEPLSCVEY